MSKTKIRWTNHRDKDKNGKTVDVDQSAAKVLIRDGLAVAAGPAKKSEPKTESKPAEKPEPKK